MTDKMRDAVFQLTGGLLALAISVAGILWAIAFLGPPGRYALFVSVPVGVITGMLTIKLLETASRILRDE